MTSEIRFDIECFDKRKLIVINNRIILNIFCCNKNSFKAKKKIKKHNK